MWKLFGKRRAATLAAATAAALILAGCGGDDGTDQAEPDADGLVTINYIQVGLSATTWPMFIGEEKGFFEANGVRIERVLTQQSPGVAQGLIAGSAQIGSAGVPDLVRPILQGGELSIAAVGVARPPFVIVTTDEVSSWQDLRGEAVSVDNAQGIGRFFFDVGAEANNLGPDEVDFIYVGSTPDRFAALSSGSVTASMLSPPFTERALSAGYPALANVADYMPDAPFQALAVNKEWAEANRDVATAFFKAYSQSIAWLNDTANRQEAAEILAEATNSSVEDSLTSYDFYVTEIQAFQEDPRIDTAKLDEFLTAMNERGFFQTDLEPSATFVDSSFVEAATSS